jgi:hypothetical protein
MVAIAGAVVLVGLVGFALFRRMSPAVSAPPGGPAPAAAPGAPADPNQPAQAGTEISAKPPFRLSPEASILAERYRCVCGCNDTLSVCTCRNPKGSEEMKQTLQALADQRKSPEEADAVMEQTYGAAALLKNPAPPQTLPSMAGPPPAQPAHPKKHS